MTTVMKKVDAVIVGFGWTGAIMAKELTEAGLNVVALERSCMARSNTRQVSSATRSYRLLPCCAAPGVVIALVR